MSLLWPGRPFCFSLPGKRQGSAVMGNILVSQTPGFVVLLLRREVSQSMRWSPSCHQICLKQAAAPQRLVNPSRVPDVTGVPPEYLDFKEVFSKTKVTSLPPHRPYDCAIDLHPGTSPPRGRLYSLSAPERVAMETYINNSLAAGIVRPSSSPAGAGFFFVEKKDKTLRPCIDFWGLNDITIKNRYPLPLISSAFELLQGATIFTKLDLRNAYHLVHIREGMSGRPPSTPPRGTTSIW